jgi:acetyl-CoA acetyltransferase
MVAYPFRIFVARIEPDGAGAVVVAPRARARDCAQRPIEILATAQGTVHGYGWGPFATHDIPDEHYATGGGTSVARRLWARAGLGPGDVDVAQLYDHFSGLVLLSLEDFGFCAPGASGSFVASGALAWPGGTLPTNTHGGSLSEAYIHGLNHVVEGVRQLRGTSTCPVDGAEVCLVTSAAGVPTSALVLGRR